LPHLFFDFADHRLLRQPPPPILAHLLSVLHRPVSRARTSSRTSALVGERRMGKVFGSQPIRFAMLM
jgi:hypothetical protein